MKTRWNKGLILLMFSISSSLRTPAIHPRTCPGGLVYYSAMFVFGLLIVTSVKNWSICSRLKKITDGIADKTKWKKSVRCTVCLLLHAVFLFFCLRLLFYSRWRKYKTGEENFMRLVILQNCKDYFSFLGKALNKFKVSRYMSLSCLENIISSSKFIYLLVRLCHPLTAIWTKYRKHAVKI